MRIRQKIRPIQLDADWQTPVEPQSVQNPSPKNLDLVLPCFQIRPIRPFRPFRPKTQMYTHEQGADGLGRGRSLNWGG